MKWSSSPHLQCYIAEHSWDNDRGCQSHSAPSPAPVSSRCRTGRRCLWHLISMACQLKANVPTCLPLYVALLQILPGLSYCLLTEPKATSHLHLRGGAGSACVDDESDVWASERCVWRRGEEKERADQRAARAICQLIDEEHRREKWVERWRRRKKMIKRSCGCFSGYNSNPFSFIVSLNMTDTERGT